MVKMLHVFIIGSLQLRKHFHLWNENKFTLPFSQKWNQSKPMVWMCFCQAMCWFRESWLTQIPRLIGSASHRSHRSHGIARLVLNLTDASRLLHSKGSHRSHRSHGIARLTLNLTEVSVSGGLIWGCCGGGKHLFYPFKSNLHLFKINYKNRW